MVLEAFVGPCPIGYEGCHNDGDPSNNQVANLRWDTHRNNQLDQLKHGTKSNPPVSFGENHPHSKLTSRQVADIKGAQWFLGVNEALAREFNISSASIARIRAGKQRVSE